MGLAPTPDLNHRVTLQLAGPVRPAKFALFRGELHQLAKQFGAKVLEEVKTKKQRRRKKR